MSRTAALLVFTLTFLAACRSAPQEAPKNFEQPLPPGAPALLPVPLGDWPSFAHQWASRDTLLVALTRSIDWTRRESSKRFYPIEGITHARALASLERFRELLGETRTPAEFEAALRREFALFRSAGWDGRGGGVLFTAYCTPVIEGRLERGGAFRYPLFGLPDDLQKGPAGEILGQETPFGLRPYPTREVIEASAMLEGRGLELVWFRSALDAFIAHVNGSAFVRLADNSMARFGYAGNNGHEYTSLARELVADGRLGPGESNLAGIRAGAQRNPGEVQRYLNRNHRFVFFTPIEGMPRGSLNLEVTPGRTLATDKSIFPRGALTYVETHVPGATYTDGERIEAFLLDQDTGGGIRTAGRADIYLGIGDEAERQAGYTRVEGQLYYLFLAGTAPAPQG
jgi:membrane-bound lytic murein transglycosylase A